MKHTILEKPIVPVINPTENQKAVLAKIVAAETPKLAANDISKNRNLVVARDMLKKLGFITLDDEGATLTDEGTKVLTDQGLADDMGELTDSGRKVAFADDPEKEAEGEAGFGGETDLDAGGMGGGRGEDPFAMEKYTAISHLRAQAITESLESVPKQILRNLSPEEQHQLRQVIDDKAELMDFNDLYEKLFDYFMSEMPYGTAKARTGDPDQWIVDRLRGDIGEGPFRAHHPWDD